ncbi:MAG: GAF domain-containing protein, partial [Anaerolineae bacterium]|nr:GAF domain-containing protein [Anaerolineae bacterium]
MRLRYLILAIVFGLLAWVADAAVDVWIQHEGAFWDLALLNIPYYEFWDRLAPMAAIIALGVVTTVMDVRRATAHQRAERLNRVLHAISQVNQLIVRQSDPQELMQRACRALVQERGYHAAWIALLRGDQLELAGAAGLGEHEAWLAETLASGDWPTCVRRALETDQVIEIRDRLDTCPTCPLRTQPAPDTVFAVTLRRGQATLGILCAQVPLAKHIRA